MSTRNEAMNKTVNTEVQEPSINPLDSSTSLAQTTHSKLTADDETETQTTPEASLAHTDLEPVDEFESQDSTSQSTLSGTTFHTTQRTTKMGDGDESQSWQIRETQRGTGHTEH